MGRDINGIPTGLQIIAPRFRGNIALGLASHLEQIAPWPLVAPNYLPIDV